MLKEIKNKVMDFIRIIAPIVPAASKSVSKPAEIVRETFKKITGKIVYSENDLPNPQLPIANKKTLNRSTVDIKLTPSSLYQGFVEEEGKKNTVYKDSLGKLTVGIGHLVTKNDNLKFGQVISDDKVLEFFKVDVMEALNAAKKQAKELDDATTENFYTVEFIEALTHVNYQLGIFWRTNFPKIWAALKAGNYSSAISRLKTTKWAKQTPDRVANFINAIQQTVA